MEFEVLFPAHVLAMAVVLLEVQGHGNCFTVCPPLQLIDGQGESA